MTAPTPIASGMRLTPARLNRPAWQTYVGTIWTAVSSNPSIGNGTVSLRWRYIDDEQVQVRYYIRPGSTTTFGSGAYQLALPVAAVSGGPDPLLVGCVQMGSPIYPLVGRAATASSSATVVTILRSNVTSQENYASWTATAPATFASGHTFSMSGTYFVA